MCEHILISFQGKQHLTNIHNLLHKMTSIGETSGEDILVATDAFSLAVTNKVDGPDEQKLQTDLADAQLIVPSDATLKVSMQEFGDDSNQSPSIARSGLHKTC